MTAPDRRFFIGEVDMRTNCNNCGGVLVDGKCPYCGTEWFRPGVSFGRGIITQASVTFSNDAINCTCFGGAYTQHVLPFKPTAEVELRIIGMTDDDLLRLMQAIGMARKDNS